MHRRLSLGGAFNLLAQVAVDLLQPIRVRDLARQIGQVRKQGVNILLDGFRGRMLVCGVNKPPGGQPAGDIHGRHERSVAKNRKQIRGLEPHQPPRNQGPPLFGEGDFRGGRLGLLGPVPKLDVFFGKLPDSRPRAARKPRFAVFGASAPWPPYSLNRMSVHVVLVVLVVLFEGPVAKTTPFFGPLRAAVGFKFSEEPIFRKESF